MEAKPPKELADYLMALEREEELDAERNEVGRELIVVGRVFGVALRGVLHSALRGHFGVVDWSGTPPGGVRSASWSGVAKQHSMALHSTMWSGRWIGVWNWHSTPYFE